MISFDLALERIYAHAKPLESVRVPLMDTCGRVASEHVVSPMMSPPFDNSAMDGFALNEDETRLATPSNPLYFSIKNTLAAGQTSPFFGEKTTVKIMTGAPLPKGYNSVLVVEEAQIVTVDDENQLRITKPVNSNQNVRRQGEDIAYHDELIKPGEHINANRLMTLATIGVASVAVTRTLRVGILSTGNEIIDDYDEPLSQGKIYNSNYPYLKHVLKASGVEEQYLGNFPDDLISFKNHIDRFLSDENGPDLIISTGAVSKGDYDYIPGALRDLGGEIVFHGVNIRPGKPILFASFGKKYYFGLPGNPISAAVGYQFFIRPLIRQLQGLPPCPPVFAKLNNSFLKKGLFRQFLKARAHFNLEGQLCVTILKNQESSRVKPFLQVNAWVIVNEDISELKSGDIVPLVLMPYCSIEDLTCE